MKATHYLTSGLRGIVAAAFLSCAGPTLATRPYTEANRQENAYLNMRDILTDLCCLGMSRTDSWCRDNFKIDPYQGFHCVQSTEKGWITSHFGWDEIEKVECVGRIVQIKGKYDSSNIWAVGPPWGGYPQCHDLEKAMRIYLQERKK